jgi:protein-L-isoaspartate(D-aspartate) O-methyltransferase
MPREWRANKGFAGLRGACFSEPPRRHSHLTAQSAKSRAMKGLIAFKMLLLPRFCGMTVKTETKPMSSAMTDFAARRTMMVDTQVRPSDVTKFPIIDAMLSVPREVYVPRDQREAAYVGENLQIAPGRVMLEPRSFGKLLDALDVHAGDLVLDLGCGLGYSTAVVARMAEAVVAVEDDESMAAEAQSRLSEEGADNAAVITGPLSEGAAKHGPYDVIIIQGGVETLPETLIAQLKEGGRIGCIFMEGGLGVARIGHKHLTGLTWRYAFNATAPVLQGFEKTAEFSL